MSWNYCRNCRGLYHKLTRPEKTKTKGVKTITEIITDTTDMTKDE